MIKHFNVIAMSLMTLLGSQASLAAMLLNQNTQQTVMFVQTSPRIDLTAIKSQLKKEGQYYKLTLHQVAPYVTYFSNRPYRMTNIMPTSEYSQLWLKTQNGFEKNPPNADITGVMKIDATHEAQINLPVELVNAHYYSKQKKLIFIVRPLKGDRRKMKEMHLLYGTLFVDQWCWSCSG